MENTTQIDEFVSKVMKTIEDEASAAYYYGKPPYQSRSVLYEIEKQLSSQLAMQYQRGWNDGLKQAIKLAERKGIGGKK